MARDSREERWRRYWDRSARKYNRQMGFCDRHVFTGCREWVCSRAEGRVLEVAIGTGLNLSYYPGCVDLTGLERSGAMLEQAVARARRLNLTVDLCQGDAQATGFPAASFDTVVCTFSLCAIPDDRRAVQEMARVLRPGGLLLLADHVASSLWLARMAQALVEVVTVPMGGEHFRRRPLAHVQALGFTLEAHDRYKLGIVERLAARKPRSNGSGSG